MTGASDADPAFFMGYAQAEVVPGWSSLVILNLPFSGGVLIGVGEYKAGIFEQVKERPLYFVRRRIGPADEPSGDDEWS